ncbi:Gfo/Idh/MocA family protein [Azospirillum sp. Marseille-Q6669]
MKRLKAGVIGLGVGERHVATYKSLTGIEVKSVCDVDPQRLAEVADRQDVAGRFTDYRGITEDPEIDVVSICSYDDAHAAQCLSAFRNGKHVMVEKPVVLFRKDAEAVLRAQQDSGKLITSNLILRRSPRFRELRRQIADGEFGEIVAIEGDYLHQILWKLTEGWRGRMGFYCVAYGGGIHLIDLMRWLIGQEVTEVCGMANKILTAGSAYQFDDTTINLLRFERGTLGKSMSCLGPQRTKFHALNVYGVKRTFINDLPHAKLFDGDEPRNESAVMTPYPAIDKGDLLPEFVQAIREGHEPDVGARDIFRIMDVCFACWESIRSGRTLPVSYLI